MQLATPLTYAQIQQQLENRLDVIFKQIEHDRTPLTVQEVCDRAQCFPTEIFATKRIKKYRSAMMSARGGWEKYRREISSRAKLIIAELEDCERHITQKGVAMRLGLTVKNLKEDHPDIWILVEDSNLPKLNISNLALCQKCQILKPTHRTIKGRRWGKSALLCYCQDCSP